MMGLDLIGGMGWRDVVLIAAAVIGVYLVLSVMRLFQVAGKSHGGVPMEPKRGLFGRQAEVAEATGAEPGTGFAGELARTTAEVELQHLRRECAALRQEMDGLTEEVGRLKAACNVSPLYNEAMALAQQGMAVDGIAGHCGISIGEAELVAALARGASEFEQHEHGEDRDERNTDSGNRLQH